MMGEDQFAYIRTLPKEGGKKYVCIDYQSHNPCLFAMPDFTFSAIFSTSASVNWLPSSSLSSRFRILSRFIFSSKSSAVVFDQFTSPNSFISFFILAGIENVTFTLSIFTPPYLHYF